ncbi:hypothetical protein MJO28_006192 [Puccinia striiformis f. sp. tritici]|uniref:Uncharacterized protein n=1 Tax=Puccinia striiformis f. sp. tritici TaxID=168172 RepID=A0ACC0EGW9_9BASI|nr:hypothetical protein MJO28_006192 [Puccinia striiformis f. sp. tritici]
MPMLIQHNTQVLTSVYQTLAIVNSSRWCFRSLKTYHNIELHPAEVIAEQYLKPYFGTLLPDLAELLRKASSASSLTTCISRQQIVLMSSLAITDTTHSERFCELILTLQLKNQVIVAEHIQAGLLHLLAGFLSTALRVASSPLCFNMLSKLLRSVMSRKGRISLCIQSEIIRTTRSATESANVCKI